MKASIKDIRTARVVIADALSITPQYLKAFVITSLSTGDPLVSEPDDFDELFELVDELCTATYDGLCEAIKTQTGGLV